MKKIGIGIIATLLLILGACGEDEGELETILFGDAQWDSLNVHNHIARTILEEGYGYDTDTQIGSVASVMQGLRKGDLQVYMEVWSDNIKDLYEEALDSGDIVQASVNFDDNVQGLYVPTYVIEGDPERGIEPMAPDLRTVEDLKDYADVFVNPEDPSRGRILNAPSGWAIEAIVSEKHESYGLDETMDNFLPGSESSLIADLVYAYENGEAWVGYYWSPTWITAKYDLTLLEEPAFDREIWDENKQTEFPPNDVAIAVHENFPEQAPEAYEFLQNYETNSDLIEDALNYMDDNDATTKDAAIYVLNEYEDIWTSWVDEDIADKVKESIK